MSNDVLLSRTTEKSIDGLSVSVRRGYVDTSVGQMHYRSAGEQGPWVVLLHETPMSSAQLETPLIAMAKWCRVIAWDTPGYGSSDELPSGCSVDDYAGVIAEATSILTRSATYAVCGTHTGACIAISMAQSVAEVAAIVLVGIPSYSEDELTERRTNGAQPRQPDPQGTHLRFAWQRVRKSWPDATPTQAHNAAVALLSVLDRYERAYDAVFAYDTEPELASVRVPTLALAASGDPLAAVTASLAAKYEIEHHEFPNVAGPLLRVRPDRVSEIVRDFLSRTTEMMGSTAK